MVQFTGNYIRPQKQRNEKMSVGEFNANPEVKQLSGIVHRYLNENLPTGSGLLGMKEDADEYLDRPSESIRDEYGSLSTLAARRAAINNAPEEVKKAYARLLNLWENQTEIKGFGEGLEATKDYLIDIFTSPETFIGAGALAGKTAGKTALRSAGVGAAWSGADDYIRQSKDVEIDRLDEISNAQALASIGAGAVFGGGLGYGGHKLAQFFNKNTDPKLLTKAEAEELETKINKSEIVPIEDKEIPKSKIDKIRDDYFEATRELQRRNRIYGVNRDKGFIPPEEQEPLLFGGALAKAAEKNLRELNRTPRETPAAIKIGTHRKSKVTSTNKRAVGAFFNAEEDTIYIDPALIRSQFKDQPWANPKMEGVEALPKEFVEEFIQTPDDWVRFVELHERVHTEFRPLLNKESKAAYENRVNKIAMQEMEKPEIFLDSDVVPDVVKKFNKEYGGGGPKTDQELNDIINGTMAQLEGATEGQVDSALAYNLSRYANRFGSNLFFKPSSVIDPFVKNSTLARELQKKFRYDSQRDLFGARKFDDQDFGEVFKEILGGNYVTFKRALHPIQSSTTGKLTENVNRVLAQLVRNPNLENPSQTLEQSRTAIRGLLDKIGEDLLEAGVIRNKVENNYFPRSWKRENLVKNSSIFKNKLVQVGQAKDLDEAQLILNSMLDKKNQLDQGGSGAGSFFYSRPLNKITDDTVFEEFLDSDVNAVMINYIAQTAKALAKRKVFNVNNLEEFTSFYIDGIDTQMRKAGKQLTLRDKQSLQKVYNYATGENLDRFEGIPGLALDLYGTVNRLAYLPLATISSLTEVAINIAKAGPTTALKGFAGALNDARGTIQDKSLEVLKKQGLTEREAWRELQEFGMDLDPVLVDTVERLSGSLIRNSKLQKVNNTFFRFTLLDQWTKFVQLTSYKTGKQLIIKNLKAINQARPTKPRDSLGRFFKPDNALYFPGDSSRIKNMKDQLNELGVNIEEGIKWIRGGESLDDAFYKDIKRGAARYTNEVILMPSAESGLKPFFTGDPKTSILFQFLGYPIAFTNTVLKNAAKDILRNPTQNAPKALAAGLIMTEMARWTNWARSRGKSEKNKSNLEIYSSAITRWGGNGIVADMMGKAREATRVYQDPVAGYASFFGPVGNDIYKIIKRGDLVRIAGEKVPGYGALGFISPEAKVAYTDFLREKARDFKKASVKALGAEREVEATLNMAEGGLATTGSTVENVPNVAKEPQERMNPYTGEPYDVTAGSFNQDLIDRNDRSDPLRRLGFSTGSIVARESYVLGAIVKGATKAGTKGIKLFHGTGKDFDNFDSKFAEETAFGKGFSFTPEKKIAKNYAAMTPKQIKDLYGKEYVDAALERKKDGTPILYEVNAKLDPTEILLARKNLLDQNPGIQDKINKLVVGENIDPSKIDFDKPKFWRQLLKESNKDADELFSKYGIKAALKDATGSEIKQVGGQLEYTVYDPKVLNVVDKQRLKKAEGSFVNQNSFKNIAHGQIAKLIGFKPENLQFAIDSDKKYDLQSRLRGEGDSIRHVMLGAAAYYSDNPNFAKKAIDLRDKFSFDDRRGIRKDLKNNQIGFDLAKESDSMEEVLEKALVLAKEGKLGKFK